ncbi:AAHS family 4-hydroxybenzoate transporter-like MFS transporter [Arthrobacter pascens]|uniref:MFS transporter n=1 Tax=Arthrobacter pascens TaxID=1677 RepID=UPI00285818DC|nr:MFS transporter [Arthrobacter pascens]MDR6558902.1 AAHS family 4-hydroxybenzoate transporter-like MFS transporter [Arthrobacter pascens]
MDTMSEPKKQEETKPNWWVLCLACAAIVLDGYDTVALGVSIPAIAKDWGVAPSHFTPALALTSAGVALGYLAVGRLVAKMGTRNVIFSAVVVFTLGSLLTAWSDSILQLTILRFVTGLGLGAVLPAAVAHATAVNPARLRQSIAVVVMTGISVGALIAGLAGSGIVGALGWEWVFIIGAIASAVLLPFLWFGLSASHVLSTPIDAAEAKHHASVARLFDASVRSRTLILWAFAFLIFASFYVFSSWLPTLLTSYGFSTGLAPLGSAALGVGSIIGACVLIIASRRFRMTSVLAGTSAVAIVFLVISAFLGPDKALLLLVFGGVGLGLQAGMIGQAAVAVSLYPQATVTAGVGWAASMGRLGSVVGPIFGGVLIGLGVDTSIIVLSVCVPVIIALILVLILGRITAAKASVPTSLHPAKSLLTAPRT